MNSSGIFKPMNGLILIILTTLIGCGSIKSHHKGNKNFIVGFYNVENLFDTIDDPNNSGDDEYIMESKKNWNTKRYYQKVNDLAHVISVFDKPELPDIIGFAEIENQLVLADITKSKYLENEEYKIVHFNCNDHRGIDVGLIYKHKSFKVLKSESIFVKIEPDSDYENYTTRDILYVKGLALKTDTLHIFVNHWPSRRGGLKKSENKRITAAKVLRSKVDSLLSISKETNIIIMGDMNDEPTNKSLNEVLKAKKKATKSDELINLMYLLHENKKGTYSYRGNWNMLDHIIVSNFLHKKEKGLTLVNKKNAYILMKDWMMYKNEKKGYSSPNKTYGGSNYYGGISDHLPIFIKFTLNL